MTKMTLPEWVIVAFIFGIVTIIVLNETSNYVLQ